MKFLIISKDNLWTKKLISKLDSLDFEFVYSSECNIELFKKVNPSCSFFFHWSEIVQKEIYSTYKCIVIHTGNLPKDRGGSPIQNQILKGTTFTKVNAIEMAQSVDSGSVYCSRPITLQGNIADIWLSIADATAELITECIRYNPTPLPQAGKPEALKRIKTNALDLNSNKSLYYLYDQIRMVDSPDYPNAYLKENGFKFEFSRAKLDNNSIIADVRITTE